MDTIKFASRKFLMTLLGLGAYLIYCFITPGYHVDPMGVTTIIAAYGLVNAYAKNNTKDN